MLFIIELFPILALSQSPFISVNSCDINQTFVINRDHGAICNNDESYIKNSVQYMISRKKFYEFVPNNISESQEFVCKVNSMQYSDVLFVDTNMTKEPQSAIPIVCHVPDTAKGFYTDVEVWSYKPSTNTADLMKIVGTTEPSATEWNEYIDHVQFSRSENIAGLKGDYGSTVLRWDDAPYNPCGNCSATTNGLVFNNTFKSENYCLLRENYCVYSDSVNCTSSFGGACFDSSALTAPAPPPRLPPPPFPPGLAPPPSLISCTYTEGSVEKLRTTKVVPNHEAFLTSADISNLILWFLAVPKYIDTSVYDEKRMVRCSNWDNSGSGDNTISSADISNIILKFLDNSISLPIHIT